jgi:hypothetical protein
MGSLIGRWWLQRLALASPWLDIAQMVLASWQAGQVELRPIHRARAYATSNPRQRRPAGARNRIEGRALLRPRLGGIFTVTLSRRARGRAPSSSAGSHCGGPGRKISVRPGNPDRQQTSRNPVGRPAFIWRISAISRSPFSYVVAAIRGAWTFRLRTIV